MKEKEIKNEELEVKASEETQATEPKEEAKTEEQQAPVEEPKEAKKDESPEPKKGVLEKIGNGAKKAAGWIIGGVVVLGGAILYGSSKYNEGRADQAALDLKAQQKGQEALPDNSNSDEVSEEVEDVEFREISSDEQSEE